MHSRLPGGCGAGRQTLLLCLKHSGDRVAPVGIGVFVEGGKHAYLQALACGQLRGDVEALPIQCHLSAGAGDSLGQDDPSPQFQGGGSVQQGLPLRTKGCPPEVWAVEIPDVQIRGNVQPAAPCQLWYDDVTQGQQMSVCHTGKAQGGHHRPAGEAGLPPLAGTGEIHPLPVDFGLALQYGKRGAIQPSTHPEGIWHVDRLPPVQAPLIK